MQEKLQSSLLNVGDYLKMGWSEFTKNIQTFLGFTLLINIPINAITFVELFLSSSEESSTANAGITNLLSLLSLIFYILSILAALALPKIIERSIRGSTLDATIALKNAVSKLFITIVVSIFASIFVGIGLIFLLIPGIWLGTLLSFTYYAVILRNCGFNALGYSQSLVKGRWWAVFGRNILLLCLVLPVTLLAIAASIIGGITGSLPILASLGIINLAVLENIDIDNLNIILAVVQLLSSLILSLLSYYIGAVYTVMFLNFDYTRNPPLEIS